MLLDYVCELLALSTNPKISWLSPMLGVKKDVNKFLLPIKDPTFFIFDMSHQFLAILGLQRRNIVFQSIRN